MKIGILTFHRAENFGAALQVYALQEYVKSLGHDVDVIDYMCRPIERQYHIFNPWILFSRKNVLYTSRLYLRRLVNNRRLRLKKRLFDRFRGRYLNISSKQTEIKSDLGYDAYIVGSDQVWRLGLTGGVDRHYFLQFPMCPDAIRIAYAASSESSDFGRLGENMPLVSSYLDSFDYISVREEALKCELQPHVRQRIEVCLDPTFLMAKGFYERLAIKPDIGDYILVYHIFESSAASVMADVIAKDKGLRVVEVHAGVKAGSSADGHTDIYTFDPCEMLGLIANARFVVTTSFHGLALSLILQKEVWAVDEGQNERIKSVLSHVGLNARLIKDISQYRKDDMIDYRKVGERLSSMVGCSRNFLAEALRRNGR